MVPERAVEVPVSRFTAAWRFLKFLSAMSMQAGTCSKVEEVLPKCWLSLCVCVCLSLSLSFLPVHFEQKWLPNWRAESAHEDRRTLCCMRRPRRAQYREEQECPAPA